jgi:hypothetical protein
MKGFNMDGMILNKGFSQYLVAALQEQVGKDIHADSGCPEGPATMAGNNAEKGPMSKKEQFLAFVWVGALAEDFSRKTNDTALIMHIASSFPEDGIPDNVMNAAKVFLAYCNGLCKRPHHWMLARG